MDMTLTQALAENGGLHPRSGAPCEQTQFLRKGLVVMSAAASGKTMVAHEMFAQAVAAGIQVRLISQGRSYARFSQRFFPGSILDEFSSRWHDPDELFLVLEVETWDRAADHSVMARKLGDIPDSALLVMDEFWTFQNWHIWDWPRLPDILFLHWFGSLPKSLWNSTYNQLLISARAADVASRSEDERVAMQLLLNPKQQKMARTLAEPARLDDVRGYGYSEWLRVWPEGEQVLRFTAGTLRTDALAFQPSRVVL